MFSKPKILLFVLVPILQAAPFHARRSYTRYSPKSDNWLVYVDLKTDVALNRTGLDIP